MTGILQVPLFSDETLPSWVARLARANGKLRASSFCTDIGLNYARLLVGRPDDIEKLAKVTGRDAADLTTHALVFDEGHRINFAGQSFFKSFVRKHQLAFCPRCFASDDARPEGHLDTRRYWRMSWLLNEATVCTHHACRLELLEQHNQSQDFGQVLEQNSAIIACHMASPVPAEPMLLDHFVAERLAGHISHGQLLDQTPLGVAIHTARYLGVAFVYGAKQSVSELTDEDVAHAANKGLHALRAGAQGVCALLDEIVDPRATTLSSAYGRLAGYLRSRNDDSYKVFEEILLEHASRRFFIYGNTMLDRNTTWTTVKEIMKATGFTRAQVITRLYQAGIISTNKAEAVPASALQLFAAEPDNLVKAKAALEIIGCDKNFLDLLVEAGLVKAAYEPGRKATGRTAFQLNFLKSELVAFRKSVEDKAQSPASADMISLRQAAFRTGVPKTEIIAKILSGACTRVALSGEQLLADNLLVDPSELRSGDGQQVGIGEAARILDVILPTMSKLVEYGVIPHGVDLTRPYKSGQKVVVRQDIAAFAERYVSVRHLVKETGLDRNLIQAKMKPANVRPAFPRNQFKTLFILKSEVGRLFE
ncbi:TniQ family protein [Rhizobium sp. X9]|uniref:TniQ family protein n=1 Tax=Rhizobium sp. X9 TaxID=2815360 RepID=UPI001C0AE0E0|nr:TniQ family protein [Rhizobium sp. X9]